MHFWKANIETWVQGLDFRTCGCHPLPKIEGWHATHSNGGPEHTDQEARTVEKKVQAMGLILSSKVLFSAIETTEKQIF